MTKATTTPAATETTFELTEDMIKARTEAAIIALADIFRDEEITETESDGVVTPMIKNRLGYLQNKLVNGVVWKLEAEMLAAHKKLSENQQILASYERAEAGVVTQRMIDNTQYWVDTHREAFMLTAIAFDTARNLHETVTGQPFKTAAQREAEAKAQKNVAQVRRPRVDTSAADAMAARLGLAG